MDENAPPITSTPFDFDTLDIAEIERVLEISYSHANLSEEFLNNNLTLPQKGVE